MDGKNQFDLTLQLGNVTNYVVLTFYSEFGKTLGGSTYLSRLECSESRLLVKGSEKFFG